MWYHSIDEPTPLGHVVPPHPLDYIERSMLTNYYHHRQVESIDSTHTVRYTVLTDSHETGFKPLVYLKGLS